MSVFSTDGGFLETRDEQLGSGGRGRVVPVDCFFDPAIELSANDLVCKVVDPRFRSEGRRQKVSLLAEMGKQGIAGVKAAWPLSGLHENGEWVGYVMPKARGRSLSEVRADREVPFQKKVQLIRRFCETIDSLHKVGVVVGDVSLANCLYDEKADDLVLIDLDSVQVVDAATRTVYPTVESREKSPEMLAGTLGELVLSSRSDDYLIAVEVFRVLFDAHPLDEYRKDVSPAKVRAENARKRRFAYELNGEACGVDIYGQGLAELFRRSFGGEYESIPSSRSYAEALRELELAQLSYCDSCGKDHAILPSDGFARSFVCKGGALMRRAGKTMSPRKLARVAMLVAAACGACFFAPEIASATTGWVTEAQAWFAQAGSWVDQASTNVDLALESAGAAFGELKAWALDAAATIEEIAGDALAWIQDAYLTVSAWLSDYMSSNL